MRKFLVALVVAVFALAMPFADLASAGDKPCPTPAPGDGPPPNCGNGKGGGGGEEPPPPPPPPSCGPKSAGGTAPGGPVTDVVWGIGAAISDGGGADLGDPVQQLACDIHAIVPI